LQNWPRRREADLRSKLSTAEQRIRELEREVEAWRGLAGNRVAGYIVEFHCAGEEGTDSFEYVFGGERRDGHKWVEVSSSSKQGAAIALAEKLGLISKADTNASEGK
jgi:hypothetical protein